MSCVVVVVGSDDLESHAPTAHPIASTTTDTRLRNTSQNLPYDKHGHRRSAAGLYLPPTVGERITTAYSSGV